MDDRRPRRSASLAASAGRGRVRRPPPAGERWVALFLLALLLFSPPVLSITSGHHLLAVPFLYVYLLVAWGLVIALLAMTAEGGYRGREAEGAAPGARDSDTPVLEPQGKD